MTILISISLLIEKLVECLKEAFPGLKGRSAVLWAISSVAGVGLCLAFNADLFAQFSLPAAVPYVGTVLSGVICGAGSNLLHDAANALAGNDQTFLQTNHKGIRPTLETSLAEDKDEGVM